MLFYFIKTILLLALFYSLFKLFIQNKDSYRWNRYYLFFTSLSAFIVPLISLKGLASYARIQSFISNDITQMNEKIKLTLFSFESEYAKFIFITLLMGMLWGLTRIAFGLYILYQLKKNALVEEFNSIKIYFHSSIEIPFTFFNIIFCPANFKQQNNFNLSLLHENAHIKLNHSFGKLFFSVAQAIFWFNPFVHLYHRELDLQHEYEADEFASQNNDRDLYCKNYLTHLNELRSPSLLVHGYFHHHSLARLNRIEFTQTQSLIQKSMLILLVLLLITLSLLL